MKLEQIFYFITGSLFICFSIGVFFAETLTFDNAHFFNLNSFLKSGDSFAKSQVKSFQRNPLKNIPDCLFNSALLHITLCLLSFIQYELSRTLWTLPSSANRRCISCFLRIVYVINYAL